MIEKLHDNLLTITMAILGGASTACAWVVRRMLTDSRRIDLLEERQELQNLALATAVESLATRLDRLAQSNDTAINTQAKIVALLAKLSEGDRP